MNQIGPNAEPGTGTQIHVFASPPDVDDDKPCTKRINGRTWKVGHDYLDVEAADVCTLVEIIGRSSWCEPRLCLGEHSGECNEVSEPRCDGRHPSDCSPELVFEYERREGQSRVDPNRPDFYDDWFIERYTPNPPPSVDCPW